MRSQRTDSYIEVKVSISGRVSYLKTVLLHVSRVSLQTPPLRPLDRRRGDQGQPGRNRRISFLLLHTPAALLHYRRAPRGSSNPDQKSQPIQRQHLALAPRFSPPSPSPPPLVSPNTDTLGGFAPIVLRKRKGQKPLPFEFSGLSSKQ